MEAIFRLNAPFFFFFFPTQLLRLGGDFDFHRTLELFIALISMNSAGVCLDRRSDFIFCPFCA